MNRTDLIKIIATNIGITQLCAGSVLDVITKATAASLARGEDVEIHGLAKFKVEHKEARTGRNPSTGAEIQIPAKNVVKVKAAKALTDTVNT